MPLKPADCGLDAPLSVMDRDADRVPLAVGVKVTFTVQEPDAARLAGQLLVCAKSPAFVPVIVMLEILSVPGPLLVTVTGVEPLVVPTFWFPNETLEGDKFTTGTGATPVPLKVADWGLDAPLSAMFSEADLEPATVGVKVTLTAQEAETASVAGLTGQLLVCE